MIRIIKRNLNKTSLIEKRWDWHFAFFHFKNYKNFYINGKPLKPWHLFRNGDVIEIIERPNGGLLWAAGGWLLTSLGVSTASTAMVYAAGVLVVGVVGAAIATVGLGIASIFTRSGSSTTQSKEYSSSTQPWVGQ